MSREFSSEELHRFAAAIPQGTEFEVERKVRVEAEKKLVQMARDLAFETERPLLDALAHVTEKHPELLRLSRAPIAANHRDADVVFV